MRKRGLSQFFVSAYALTVLAAAADSRALLPTLKGFKTRHPDIKPSIFLGDAAFDTIEIYKSLFEDFNFTKAFTPLKVNLSMDNVKPRLFIVTP